MYIRVLRIATFVFAITNGKYMLSMSGCVYECVCAWVFVLSSIHRKSAEESDD